MLKSAGVRYCVVHHGIANEDDEECDFAHDGGENEDQWCDFRDLVYEADG